jgi:hypothetical protein
VSDSLQNLIALRRIGVKPENIAFFADCTPATIKGLLAAGDSDDESKLSPKPLHHLFKEETIGEGGLQLMGYGHGESGETSFPAVVWHVLTANSSTGPVHSRAGI